MCFANRSESRYLTYQDPSYPQPSLAQDPHRLPSPEFYCVFCGHYLSASPVQCAAGYGPCVFFIQNGHHPPPAEHEPPADDIAYPTKTSSGQPLHPHLSYVEGAGQPVPRDLAPQVPYFSARKFPVSDTIWFFVNGEIGFRLSDALGDNWVGFQGRDDIPSFGGDRQQIMLRVQPTECPPWHSKVNIKDFRANPRPITRARLATEVAKSIGKFIAREKQRGDAGQPRSRWADLELKNIFLTRLVRVSVASWQPEIFVERV